jgi:diguanylate cyclase (GGDEF)-like protein
MHESSRVVESASARSLDRVLDAAATLLAVVTTGGELVHGDRWLDAIPDGERFAAREALARVAHGESPVHVDLSFGGHDDGPHPVCWTLTGLPGPDVEAELRDLTDRDALTGLLNRRRFEQELESHLAHGRRYGMTGALIVLDLNDFKAVNEAHGPRAGDRVLIAVAEALANRLRDSDLLARVGGNQFAVLLPQAKPHEAERVSQALEDVVGEELQLPGKRRMEASVGFAPFTATLASVEEVQLAAEAAMYAVKAGLPRHSRRLRPVE